MAGEVYEAKDTYMDRKVAIKVLSGVSDPAAVLREAKLGALEGFVHENVVTVHNVVVDAESPFIVMEYVEGSLEGCLKECIREGSWLEYEEAVNILDQCFQGLIAAHDRSVIHGDVKPGNVLLQRGDTEQWVAKISDFGVAKVLSDRTPRVIEYGTGDRALGSKSYMPPEILQGASRDERTDVFSLGVLAYLLFTQVHPFCPTDRSGLFTVVDALLSEAPPPKVSELNTEVPEGLSRVIMRMVAREQDNMERYGSLKEAYDDFGDHTFPEDSPPDGQPPAPCPVCGGQVGPHDPYCKHCGSKIPRLERRCMSCGHRVPAGDAYCGRCGAPVTGGEREDDRTNRLDLLSPEELHTKAFHANGRAEYEKGLEFSEEAIERRPEWAQAWQTKGYSLSNLGRYAEAKEAFEEALRHCDDRAQEARIRTNLSYVHMKEHRDGLMLKQLERAVELDPDYAKPRRLLDKYRGDERR